MSSAVDPRVVEARRKAAHKATQVRSKRALVKQRIGAGEIDLGPILRGADATIAAGVAEEIRIGELLRSVPGIGPTTSSEILEDLAIAADRPLGDVPMAKRAALADVIATERS